MPAKLRPMPTPPTQDLSPLPAGLQKLVSVLGSLIGANDPTQLPSPAAMTGFLTPQGVPDVAARIAASTKGQQSLYDALQMLVRQGKTSPLDVNHAMSMASRFPRVLAHIANVEPLPKEVEAAIPGIKGGQTGTLLRRRVAGTLPVDDAIPWNERTKLARQSDLIIGPSGFVPNTVLHEMTHAGQQIRRGQNFSLAYKLENMLRGYHGNRFEKNARQVAHRALELPNQYQKDPYWTQLMDLARAFAGQ